MLLAAGRSTRMGAEKALLQQDGVPLWQRQRDVLRAAGATELFLSVRPEQSWATQADGFEGKVYDAFPDCGPIAGITAALERMSHSHLLVLAIDLPAVTTDWFEMLRREAEPARGWVGRREGFFEPLAAIYPRELKWLAWETVARGDYSLQRLLTAAVENEFMRVHEITPAEAVLFRNWNRPA